MGNLDFSANADQLQELLSYIASQINMPTIGIGGGDAPIGKIDFFEANVAPQDWLACDGTVYNIADYPQLAEHYTAVYGEANHWGGNGTTTFAVPDLRGEFLRGTGTNSHANQGNGGSVGEHQDGTDHIMLGHGSEGLFGSVDAVSGNYDKNNGFSTMHTAKYFGGTSTTSSANTFTSRPTNTSFLICVKAVVAGFVYSTEERVGGTWIDGKKWYYKTVDCGALPNATTKTVAHGITNIDTVIDVHGNAIDSNKRFILLPYVHSTGMNFQVQIYGDATNLFLVTGNDWGIYSAFVTLRYTKTTD